MLYLQLLCNLFLQFAAYRTITKLTLTYVKIRYDSTSVETNQWPVATAAIVKRWNYGSIKMS